MKYIYTAIATLLIAGLSLAAYRDWSAPYCRLKYRQITTWPEYEAWYSHCQWASPPEDAGCGVDASSGTECP